MLILFQTYNAFRLETKKNTLFNLHILTRIKIYNFLITSNVFTRLLTDFMVIIYKIQNAENTQLEECLYRWFLEQRSVNIPTSDAIIFN